MHHGPVLIPDFSVVYQLVIFLVTFFILKFALFNPFKKLFELRDEKTRLRAEKAEQLASEAAAIETDVTSQIHNKRVQVHQALEVAKKEIKLKARAVVDSHKSSLTKKAEGYQQILNAEAAAAKKDLTQNESGLVKLFLDKILGDGTQVLKASSHSSQVDKNGGAAHV